MSIAKLTKRKRDKGNTDLYELKKMNHFWQNFTKLVLLKHCLHHFLFYFFYLKEFVMFHSLINFKIHPPSGLLATPHLLKQADKRSSCLIHVGRVWNTCIYRKKFDNYHKSWTHCRNITQNTRHTHKRKEKEKKRRKSSGFEPMTYRLYKLLKKYARPLRPLGYAVFAFNCFDSSLV